MEQDQGHTVYTNFGLRIYDLLVHWFNDNYVWRCPPSLLSYFFAANAGPRHMDVGVGTGYFPAAYHESRLAKGDPWPQELTLVDMNPLCLEKASARVGCPERTTCIEANVLEPVAVPVTKGTSVTSHKFDSISMMYLLHCVPPPCVRKAKAFAHLKEHLAPGGTLFGATVCGKNVEHNWIGRLSMGFYNWHGMFGNAEDDPAMFIKELKNEFEEVEADVVGVVLLFRARKPRSARGQST